MLLLDFKSESSPASRIFKIKTSRSNTRIPPLPNTDSFRKVALHPTERETGSRRKVIERECEKYSYGWLCIYGFFESRAWWRVLDACGKGGGEGHVGVACESRLDLEYADLRCGKCRNNMAAGPWCRNFAQVADSFNLAKDR